MENSRTVPDGVSTISPSSIWMRHSFTMRRAGHRLLCDLVWEVYMKAGNLQLGGGNSNSFYVHPYLNLGKMNPF